MRRRVTAIQISFFLVSAKLSPRQTNATARRHAQPSPKIPILFRSCSSARARDRPFHPKRNSWALAVKSEPPERIDGAKRHQRRAVTLVRDEPQTRAIAEMRHLLSIGTGIRGSPRSRRAEGSRSPTRWCNGPSNRVINRDLIHHRPHTRWQTPDLSRLDPRPKGARRGRGPGPAPGPRRPGMGQTPGRRGLLDGQVETST
jgi:hypothetical protein